MGGSRYDFLMILYLLHD